MNNSEFGRSTKTLRIKCNKIKMYIIIIFFIKLYQFFLSNYMELVFS